MKLWSMMLPFPIVGLVFCRYSDGVLLTHTVVGSGAQSV